MTNHLHLAFSPGLPEIILVLGVILIFFGAKKLPELAKGMGQGIKEFKKATKGVNDELERAMDDTPTYVPPPAPQLTEETAEKPEGNNDSKKDA
ncbi:MAG: twin-arginine translocase TatA/TatE family subunit [Verrucomicrobiota bacterium]|jgi:sec-independent protein translocase protein TatA|nr:twin-arginine translocase TatA/TatE family subunit [Verrucomicrobiota bacterium]